MRMDYANSDFVVDMSSHCFLCLEKIPVQLSSAKPEIELEPPAIYSLKCLSRYLKMNLINLLNEKGSITPQLLSNMKRSQLKVTLCGGCAYLTEKFSVLYRHLEKTEMELTSCLNNIHRKLLEAEGNGRREEFRKSDSKAKVEIIESVEIGEKFRMEAIKKCSDELQIASPRIRIKKWVKKNENAIPIKPTTVTTCHNVTGKYLIYRSTGVDQTRLIFNTITKKYRCDLCLKEYTERRTLKDHFKADHIQQKYKCDKCSEEFTYRQDIAKHLQTVHKIGQTIKPNLELKRIELSIKNRPLNTKRLPKPTEAIQRYNLSHSSRTARIKMYGRNQNKGKAKEEEKAAIGHGENTSSRESDAARLEMESDAISSGNILAKSIFNPQTKKHKCSLCGREYLRLPQFREHYKGDHLQQKYKCESCPKEFTFLDILKRHVRTAHNNARKISHKKYRNIIRRYPPILPKCHRAVLEGDLTPTESDPTTGVSSAPKETNQFTGKQDYIVDPLTLLYKCKKCPREYKSRSAFHRHYIAAHLNFHFYQNSNAKLGRKVKCQNCGHSFDNSVKLEFHLRNSRCGTARPEFPPEKSSVLSKDPLSISTKTGINGDSEMPGTRIEDATTVKLEPNESRDDHQDEYILPIDHSDFNSNDDVPDDKVEERQIMEEPSVEGNQLTEAYSKLNPENRKHSCTICTKEFAHKSACEQHYKSAHLKVKYKCSLCDMAFSQSSSCYRHYRDVHNPIKSFTCHICGYACTRPDNLNKHLLGVHSVV